MSALGWLCNIGQRENHRDVLRRYAVHDEARLFPEYPWHTSKSGHLTSADT